MVRLDALILAVIWLLVGCQQQAKDALVDVVGTAQGLVEPTELKGWIDAGSSVFIMDVRPIASYKQGHIPGSFQLWRNAYTRNDLPYSGMAIQREYFRKLLDSLGLRAEHHVVVYDDRGGCDAARVWWLLNVYGHKSVSLLNGGIPHWRSKQYPVALEWVGTSPSGYTFPDQVDSCLVATLDDVKGQHGILLDTRSEMEHSGAEMKEGAFRAGCIPGSILFDWGNAVDFDKAQCLKDPAHLRQQLEALGIHQDDPVITYCHSGVRSAHTTFVLSQVLGMKNVRNYDGSWTEWSYHNELPIERDSSITLDQ